MTSPTGELRRVWQAFADTECRGYAPLYERVVRTVAEDDDLLALVRAAPPAAHLPNVLLAAVHYLLLGGLDHPLGAVYRGELAADPGPLFADLCRSQRAELLAVMAVRRTQTNEVGRGTFIAPALTAVASRADGPLALVEVGASAGLNLRLDRYRIEYGERGATGPPSPVTIEAEVTGGDPPIAPAIPDLAARIGIDRAPIDLRDADDARWLLACVWPGTGRFARTRRAIEVVREHPVEIRRGDALDELPRVLDALDPRLTPCVLTTTVLMYLSPAQRSIFVAQLAAAAARRPLAWITAEARGVVDVVDECERGGAPRLAPPAEAPGAGGLLLGTVWFDRDDIAPELTAVVHPHGRHIDWRARRADRQGITDR